MLTQRIIFLYLMIMMFHLKHVLLICKYEFQTLLKESLHYYYYCCCCCCYCYCYCYYKHIVWFLKAVYGRYDEGSKQDGGHLDRKISLSELNLWKEKHSFVLQLGR